MTVASTTMVVADLEMASRQGTASQSVSSPTAADAEARRVSAAVAQGDESAFAALYDRYHGRLYRLVLVLAHGDELLAREVIQSAMLTAAAKLKPVKTESHLWNWLARVARQHLAKVWRQQQRTPTLVDLAELPEAAGAMESDSMLEQHLDAALRELETEDRHVVEWFYFDGLSHKDIADRLDTTPKAVSSRLERARVRLRSWLKRRLSHEF